MNEQHVGESLEAVRARILKSVSQYLQRYPKEIPLFVIHGRLIGELLDAFDAITWGVTNTALYRFEPPQKEGECWRVSQIALENGKPKEKELEIFGLSEVLGRDMSREHVKEENLLSRYSRNGTRQK